MRLLKENREYLIVYFVGAILSILIASGVYLTLDALEPILREPIQALVGESPDGLLKAAIVEQYTRQAIVALPPAARE